MKGRKKWRGGRGRRRRCRRQCFFFDVEMLFSFFFFSFQRNWVALSRPHNEPLEGFTVAFFTQQQAARLCSMASGKKEKWRRSSTSSMSSSIVAMLISFCLFSFQRIRFSLSRAQKEPLEDFTIAFSKLEASDEALLDAKESEQTNNDIIVQSSSKRGVVFRRRTSFPSGLPSGTAEAWELRSTKTREHQRERERRRDEGVFVPRERQRFFSSFPLGMFFFSPEIENEMKAARVPLFFPPSSRCLRASNVGYRFFVFIFYYIVFLMLDE